MNVGFDIETLPGDLDKVDQDIAEIAETLEVKPPSDANKADLVRLLGGGDDLNDLKVASLKEMYSVSPAIRAQRAENVYRKRSFDGSKGRVCSLSWSAGDGVKAVTMGVDAGTEKELLMLFKEQILDDVQRADSRAYKMTFVGHCVQFDLKFLFRRLAINKISVPFELPFHGWHGRDYFCTSYAWCGRDGRVSQDELCRVLGIEGKPEGISGSNVFDHALQNHWDQIKAYNIDDVEKVMQIYNRLK